MKLFYEDTLNRWIAGWLDIRVPIGRFLKIALGLLPIIGLLLLWYWVTAGQVEQRIISPVILPSPSEVVHSFKSLWFEAELTRSILASTLRVVGGFIAALIVVFPLGVLMGSFSRVRALFDPLMIFGAYLPIPTLVPLSMSVFGIGEMQKIMFLAVAFMVVLLPMFVKSIDDVDDVYIYTAQTLGASRFEIIRHVLFGVAKVRLFDAIRFGFGIGWTYIILAEMVAADRGLGQIIIIAQRRGPREHMYLVVLVIVLIAYVTDKAWVWLGRRLFPYRSEA